ncbi:MAG TPA: M48 family metalloprotease [Candidatus Eisenbacteria bacterium]|nr:M48 family metalloprotease [Candidatus Eisenbacteria bacterium]
MPIFLLLALGLPILLSGCASTRQAAQPALEMNDGQERVLGARLAAAFEEGESVYVDKTVLAYVNQIGQKLARLSDKPTIPYTFRVLRGEAPRGVVLPGGYIYVSAGLLRRLRSQCEVAAVLAHMVAHAALNHPAMALEKVKGVGPDGIREILEAPDRMAGVERAKSALQGWKGFPREWEADADRLTLLYLSRTAFASEGYPKSIEAFLPGSATGPVEYWEWASWGAPPLDKRVSSLREEIASMGLDVGLPCEQQAYAPIRARLGAAR